MMAKAPALSLVAIRADCRAGSVPCLHSALGYISLAFAERMAA